MLHDLHKIYNVGKLNEVCVLQGVDLMVGAGEIVVLVVLSGVGKLTLLYIVGLLDMPDSGMVSIAGTDMTCLLDCKCIGVWRGQVGFIYQFYYLLLEFSALENIVLS